MKIGSSKPEWPVEVKSGSAGVKIYRTENQGGYISFIAIYYKGHQRKTPFFQDLDEAKKEAKEIPGT